MTSLRNTEQAMKVSWTMFRVIKLQPTDTKTVDTNEVIIAISMFQYLAIGVLWIAFGTGKTFRYVPLHNFVK